MERFGLSSERGSATAARQLSCPAKKSRKALLITDAEDAWTLPDEIFAEAGIEPVRAHSIDVAADLCIRLAPSLTFLAATLDGKPTTNAMKRCLAKANAPCVVVVASNGEINEAAEAMRAGAFDCLFRPFSMARLVKTINACLEHLGETVLPAHVSLSSEQPIAPPSTAPAPAQKPVLDGSSEVIATLLQNAAAIAQSDAPTLIEGEVGTGKARLAQHIHDNSSRADKPLVTIGCATLTLALLPELFKRAEGGTLVFDELAELPVETQPHLLPLLSADNAPRIVATSSRSLRVAANTGALRPDLYYTLAVARLTIPPLRERPEDIPAIAAALLRKAAKAEGHGFDRLDDATLDILTAYPWPGNVRELSNAIRAASLFNSGPLLLPEHLPEEVRNPMRPEPEIPSGPHDLSTLIGQPMSEVERIVIEATIEAQGGSVPAAARILELSPSTIYRKRETWLKTGDASPPA